MDDDKTKTEIWYCNYCKIILTNGVVKLIDKTKIQRLLIAFSLGCPLSVYGIPEVSAAAYGNARLRECKNTEFVWELKRGFKQGGPGRTKDKFLKCLKMLPTMFVSEFVRDN